LIDGGYLVRRQQVNLNIAQSQCKVTGAAFFAFERQPVKPIFQKEGVHCKIPT